MRPSHLPLSLVPRLLAALLALALGLALALPAAAQDDSPAAQVEALALRAHLQNLRTGSRTLWIGGSLGKAGSPPLSALGDRFDPFVLPALGPSEEFNTLRMERPALLNFWASWCPPCQIEFPHLADLALEPDAHALDVVFVNVSDTEADALDFLLDQPPGLRTVRDSADRLSRRALVLSLPTSLLMDVDGTVLAVHIGVVTPTVSAFLDAVAAHPGAGWFDPAAYADTAPSADLLPVDAASARVIAFGERALGALSGGDFQHVFRFEGRAGQRILVDLTADSLTLDPYLVLMTAEGERLAEDDDSGPGEDSRIEATLPADGTYLVVATRFLEGEGFSSGDYRLTVRDAAQDSHDGIIAYGTVIEGRVSGVNPRELYAFEGAAGDLITLRVAHAPGDVGLQIELKGPDQQRLAISAPSENGVASLAEFTLPAEGTYRVTVQRPRSRETQNLDYELTLSAAE